MTKEIAQLIKGLEGVIDRTDGAGGTSYRETRGNMTRAYKTTDSILVLAEILTSESKAYMTGKPAKHSKKTLAEAQRLIRLAKWHKATEEEEEIEAWEV